MSYFKIPSNLNINIIENTFKLILKKKEEDDINQICSFNLSIYLKKTKKKIDKIYKYWDQMKIYTNPYEFIHTNVPNNNISISKYKPISRAFYKLLEIYNMFNLLNYEHPIKTFHLAEGPGGFVQYLHNNCHMALYRLNDLKLIKIILLLMFAFVLVYNVL